MGRDATYSDGEGGIVVFRTTAKHIPKVMLQLRQDQHLSSSFLSHPTLWHCLDHILTALQNNPQKCEVSSEELKKQ
jgi:hypothetical protein